MAKVTKNELGEMLADKYDMTKKDGTEAVETIFEKIKKIVDSEDEVYITDFGKFELKRTKSRKGINPATKEPITIPAKRKLKYSEAKAVKDLLNREGAGDEE